MSNLIAFINSFLSYLLVFGIIVVLAVVTCIIGVKLRKNKDAKDAAAEAELNKDTVNMQ